MKQVTIKQATEREVPGIVDVCTRANWNTYKSIYSEEYIQKVIDTYYHEKRVLQEVGAPSKEWGGYFVATDGDTVIGAGGGGLVSESSAEIYVLYMDPNRCSEGIGSQILEVLTDQQRAFGAKEQWVSVAKGNALGIPFYEKKGFVFDSEEVENEHNEVPVLRYKRRLEGNSSSYFQFLDM
ncbi:GNAT family N-acetyltransferase [Bacillus coahuilensis]|uniref:GNAT family N-acetyltransferase n=1 Tax=Bacillus coahuilensis TaxID=408580 RepID=UPI00187C219A|nr:GNAT family N-acetyltransferase [Bacillus coahuilensis]